MPLNADEKLQPLERRWLIAHLHWLMWVLPTALFILLISAAELVSKDNQQRINAENLRNLLVKSTEIRTLFEYNLNATLHLTSGLVAYVQSRHGELKDSELSPWLTNLQERAQFIRNIGIAPGNRITHVYPLEGNEGALGLYYPDNAVQWPVVQQTIANGKPMLAGPLALKQGGQGLIY